MSTSNEIGMLFVTGNVATCFEKSDTLKPWIDELLQYSNGTRDTNLKLKWKIQSIWNQGDQGRRETQHDLKVVESKHPQFIALHCQEVGGKDYEKSMTNVNAFVGYLLNHSVMKLYDRSRIFMDTNFSCQEKFTALGNIYFVHSSLTHAQIFNFKESRFEDCFGSLIVDDDMEEAAVKEKAKFPIEIFPESKWSRKGFMRTRWRLNGNSIDLVNIHLFHDASNLIGMDQFPSIYCLNRRKALTYLLDRLENDKWTNVPLVIFGDFNFRLDTQEIVKKLTVGTTIKINNENKDQQRQWLNGEGKAVLSISKKEFKHCDHQTIFVRHFIDWLLPHDKELLEFGDRLQEFPISFPPSYPFVEEGDVGGEYMSTRCPAWCDRVLMSASARELFTKASGEYEYLQLGFMKRMGDHKPVCLYTSLPPNEGKDTNCSCLISCNHIDSHGNHLQSNDKTCRMSSFLTKVFTDECCCATDEKCSAVWKRRSNSMIESGGENVDDFMTGICVAKNEETQVGETSVQYLSLNHGETRTIFKETTV